MNFFNLTQSEGNDPVSKSAQTCAARSYLATQRHAHRRSLKGTNVNKKHTARPQHPTLDPLPLHIRPNEEQLPLYASQRTTSGRSEQLQGNLQGSNTEIPLLDVSGRVFPSSHSIQTNISHFGPAHIGDDGISSDHIHLDSWVAKDRSSYDPDHGYRHDKNLPHPVSDTGFQKSSATLARFFPFDPFVCLPLEITAQEKSTLHFYLTEGRQWLLGTSVQPKCCPALKLAQSLMPVCHIYVLAHVVLGESVLSQMTQKPVREDYYLRSAQMYKAIGALLADRRATFDHKLWSLIQVAMVEHTAQRIDFKQIHVKALDKLVEDHNGLPVNTNWAMGNVFLQACSQFYGAQFARTVIPPANWQQLKSSRAGFMLSLTRVQAWMCGLRSGSNLNHHNEIDGCSRTPQLLLSYLTNLAQKEEGKNMAVDPLQTETGVLFCCLSICLTFVECRSTIDDLLKFLVYIEQYMCDTATIQRQSGHELDKLHSVAAAYIISCVRSEVLPNRSGNREFRVSQALVDSHKMFCYLGRDHQMEILMWLINCITIVSTFRSQGDAVWSTYVDFEDDKLSVLENEIEGSWRAKEGA